MSETLEHLFGSRSRSRVLRFFILNAERDFTTVDVATRNMIKTQDARRECVALAKIKFLKEKKCKGKKLYQLDPQFTYYPELKSLFVKANTYPQCHALTKVKAIGNVQLALVSGVFLNYSRSKIDFLIVADNVSRVKLAKLIKEIEAEIGKEVRYMIITTDEMKYRMDMMDRFLMEFLTGPTDEVINRMPKLENFVNDFKK